MKMKNILQHRFNLLWSRVLQIYPKKKIRVGEQGRHQKHINVFGVQPALICERK